VDQGTSRWTRYYPWIVIAFLVVLYTSSFIDRVILSLLVGPIREDLAISDTEFSLLAGFSFAVMYAIAGIPMGWIADHNSRRVVIASGCAAWSFMTALCGLATSFWSLFAARVGVGIGEAVLSPASYSLITDLAPREKLGRALSIYVMGIPIGSGLALLVGGTVVAALTGLHIELPVLGTLQPWQAVFLIIGLPGLLLALLTLIIIKEPPRTRTAEDPDAKAPSLAATVSFIWQRRGVYLALMVGTACVSIFSYASSTWMPTTLIRVHGFTAADSGLFLGTSMLLLGIPGCFFSGLLADYLIARGRPDGHVVVSKIYVWGIAFCGILGPIAPWQWLSLTLIGALGFFSFTWSGAVTALLQIITPNRMRAQTSAISLFIVSIIGLGLGPTFVGASTDYIFGEDVAVGKSLALVGAISLALALVLFEVLGRLIVKGLQQPNTESAHLRNLLRN